MNPLIDFIDAIISLSLAEKDAIDKAYDTVNIPKGNCWIKEGQYCQQTGFLMSGKMRVFYLDDLGNEVTCYFVTPDSFISSFTSFLTHTPTTENIEAIEDCVMRVISREALEKLSEIVPKMHIVRRIIAENLFITMERRVAMLQSHNAHERYEKMLRENPDIILSVPLQYTASFLGITPQHLSRLRKKST